MISFKSFLKSSSKKSPRESEEIQDRASLIALATNTKPSQRGTSAA